jgi:hypothetical protein
MNETRMKVVVAICPLMHHCDCYQHLADLIAIVVVSKIAKDAPIAWSGSLVAVVDGCSSVDPTDDLERAATRSGRMLREHVAGDQ